MRDACGLDTLIDVFSMLRLPWWDHVWIVQEAILANVSVS